MVGRGAKTKRPGFACERIKMLKASRAHKARYSHVDTFSCFIGCFTAPQSTSTSTTSQKAFVEEPSNKIQLRESCKNVGVLCAFCSSARIVWFGQDVLSCAPSIKSHQFRNIHTYHVMNNPESLIAQL